MLLSLDQDFARFVSGTILYKQDRESFFLAERTPPEESPKRPPWLRGLSAYETPFFLRLARELVEFRPETVTACDFLARFGHFYAGHRSKIEESTRALRTIVEGLLAVQRWPAIFEPLMDAMGEPAFASLPKGLAVGDLGAFLGTLLMGAQSGQLTLVRVPEVLRAMREPPAPRLDECRRIPHCWRMVEKLEPAAESAARLIEEMRRAL